MDTQTKFAVIGGTGLQDMEGLQKLQSIELETPFGKPSAPIVIGVLAGRQIAFLSRHGIGHHLLPSEVNYRANIYALKTLGVERIVSISACGSLREDYAPGDIVIPSQLFDLTRDRKRTFFGEGIVAHIGVADPFCPDLSNQLFAATKMCGGNVHEGGAFVTIEGPRFSTRSEANTFRAWGMSIVGMTASPEAFLAREAEICYTIMAHVTDYDVWHMSEEPVSVNMVIDTLKTNTSLVQRVIYTLCEGLRFDRECDCGTALANAIITRSDVIPPGTREKLDILVGKYL